MPRGLAKHSHDTSANMITQCVYELVEQVAPNDLNHYRCKYCRHERLSKYPPEMIHRNCSDRQTIRDASFLGKLSEYAKAIKHWVKNGRPVRTDDEVSHILNDICKPCNWFQDGRCGLCYCNLNLSSRAEANKIRMATESCPHDPPKWEAEERFRRIILD